MTQATDDRIRKTFKLSQMGMLEVESIATLAGDGGRTWLSNREINELACKADNLAKELRGIAAEEHK